MNINYLELKHILAIHFVVVDEYFSGTVVDSKDQRGVQNASGLLSAIETPKATFDGKDLYSTLLLKAAALMRSLIKNHPFYNGNKRTAVIVTILFLS